MTHRSRRLAAAVSFLLCLGAFADRSSAAGLFRVTSSGTDNNLSAGLGTLVWTHDYDVVKFVSSPAPGFVTLHPGFGSIFESSAAVGSSFYYSSMHTLWKTDGTAAGTAEVATLQPDVYEYTVKSLTDLGGTLFFRGYTTDTGFEPWVSNGTGPGTTMVKDIFPGFNYGYYYGDRALLGSAVYFNGDDGVNGEELWVSNGQSAGTLMVKDIQGGAPGSAPAYFLTCGSYVYFTADDGANGRELWRTDGSGGGTLMVADARTAAESSNPYELACVGAKVFFLSTNAATSQHELWVHDPAVGGAALLKSDWGCSPTNFYCGPRIHTFRAAAGLLMFAAGDGGHGVELWKSDGTVAGTVMVKDIWPGLDYSTGTPFPNSSDPYGMVEKGGKLYFAASHPDFGNEVWVSDGTAAGTWPITDAVPGPGSAWPDELTPAGSWVFFRTVGNNPYNVWGFNPADTPPYVDRVRNGSFESASTSPSWTLLKLNALRDKRVCSERSYELCSFKIVGSATAAKGLRQGLLANGTTLGAPGQTFALSGWSKSIGASGHGGFYGLEIVITYANGTTATRRVSFTRATHPWQYRRAAVTAARRWSRIAIYAHYQNQAGSAWFDDLRLTIR